MELVNLAGRPLIGKLDKKGLKKLVLLPDYSPSKGKLPIGSVAVYSLREHAPSPAFLGPDIGCGMLLARFEDFMKDDLECLAYSLAADLRLNRNGLGTLGSGNHFLDFYYSKDKGDWYLLIHTGSRLVGKSIYESGVKGEAYIREHNRALKYAAQNRREVLGKVENLHGSAGMEIIFHQPHNFLEVNGDEIVYRKGANKVSRNQPTVISSTLEGDAVIVVPERELTDTEFSIPHGTGRKVSRSEAKETEYDFHEIKKRVYIPSIIQADELRSEHPSCYRSLREVLDPLRDRVKVTSTLEPKAYVCS